MLVVGLDGWRHGWIAVALQQGRFHSAAAVAAAAAALDLYPTATVVAADMPIGLPVAGRRAADELARAQLGDRRSTVFYAPPRDVIEVEPYAAANAVAKRRHGFGISKQSYMLRPKILELDVLVAAGAAIYEVHPELAYRRIVGEALPSKKSYAGVIRRQAALRSVGIELPADIDSAGAAPLDDVLDAAVVSYVANRIATGQGRPLPAAPEVDARGRPMAIWS